MPILDELPAAEAIFHLVLEVAQLQSELATHEYFARGAITLAKFHSYDGQLFGPALVEAVSLEREVAVDPRIVLSPAASAALLDRGASSDPARRHFYEEIPILVDEDGMPFVDYLAGAFQADPELELPARLRSHQQIVAKQLEQHQANFDRWSKYRWVAEYHNATCAAYRQVLREHGDFERFLVESIHTKRHFEPLRPLH